MKKGSKKFKIVAIIMALILLPIGAFTLGYFFSNDKVNSKEVGKTLTVDGSIDGTAITGTVNDVENIFPGDTVNKSIVIKPNCTAPSLLRVKIEPYWEYEEGGQIKKKEGNNLTLKYSAGNNPLTEFLEGSNGYWYNNEDGYLYYIGQVTKNLNEMPLVDGLTFNPSEDVNDYQGKSLKIDVSLDIVQCRDSAFQSAWGITTGKLSEKLRSLCTE